MKKEKQRMRVRECAHARTHKEGIFYILCELKNHILYIECFPFGDTSRHKYHSVFVTY